MRHNPLVYSKYKTLFHGTAPDRVKKIIELGLQPGSKVGHRNFIKSKSHVFFTDTVQVAAWYCNVDAFKHGAWLVGLDYAVVELDVQGLELQPDLDDAGRHIDSELYELNQLLRREQVIKQSIKLGDLAPVEAGGLLDRYEFHYLDVDDEGILIAQPFVRYPITATYDAELEILQDDANIEFVDGFPAVEGQQFMYDGAVSIDKLVQVYLSKNLAREYGALREPSYYIDAYDEMHIRVQAEAKKYKFNTLGGADYIAAHEKFENEIWQIRDLIPRIPLFPVL